MKKAAIVLSLCLLFTLVGVGQESAELLDLTVPMGRVFQAQRPPLQPGEVGRGGGSGGGTTGEWNKPPKSPVSITLDSVDKATYQFGDRLVYEVTVENVSSEDVMIPALPDEVERDVVFSARVSGNSKNYAKAVIDLYMADEKSYYPGVIYTNLYGVTALPESFRLLRPGRKLKIRGGKNIYFGDSDFRKKLAAETPKKVELRASFKLYRINPYTFGFDEQCERAVSTNSVTIELRKYEPPDQSPSQ